MNEITLAIPFYNTSHYFKEAVELALDNDFVKEIVVSKEERTSQKMRIYIIYLWAVAIGQTFNFLKEFNIIITL